MEIVDFNRGWHFSDAATGREEDVVLPHDAMINTKRVPGGHTYFLLAGFRGGDYVYRKTLELTPELDGKKLVLEFEAVYCMTEVFVNGTKAAEKAYGFTPFAVDLNPHIRTGKNLIEVIARVPKEGHGRWYTGGGIYRPVHLLVGENSYIKRYGVRVTTKSIHPAVVETEILTCGGDEAEIAVYEKKTDRLVASGTAAVQDGRAVRQFQIDHALLWSAEEPNLYFAVVKLLEHGAVRDTVTEQFGIRTLAVDPERGLLVNQKPVFLRGGCIHNDMGVIGVINNDTTEHERAEKIKKSGFNAIRSAHHPMSRSLMKACDEVGLYVMDEAFDYWFRMKNRNPYVQHFEADFKTDTAAMVEDAYNHPSVVIYSIGNEIPEAGSVKGVRIGKEIVDTIHSLDTTRLTMLCPSVHWLREYLEGTPYLTRDEDEWIAEDPANREKDWNHYVKIFTGAVNNLPDSEKGQVYPDTYVRQDEEATGRLYPYLDIAGYNYYEERYEKLHELHPERVILGTETRHTMMVGTMRFAKTHPYLIGDFVWTLQDHLGEANCCNLHYDESEKAYKDYPWLINYGGVIDINGTILPALHRYEFAWGEYSGRPKHGLYLASQPPIHEGKAPLVESYRWTDTVEGWTYEGFEGKKTFVDAYTDADTVAVFINGNHAGTAKVNDYFAKISCIYEPGELMGIGYDRDGRELYRTTVRTAGHENIITVRTERKDLVSGGQDFAFLDVSITDREGNIKLLPDHTVTIQVEGAGKLQGFGSAYYKNEEPYDQSHHKTWQGRLRAVIRSTEEKGSIRVTFSSEGCETASVMLEAK